MSDKSYKNRDWLRERYWGDNMSTLEIAELCETGSSTIGYWLDKYDIQTRHGPTSGANQTSDDRLEDEEWLKDRYWKDGMSLREIADICSCAMSTVSDRFTKYGIQKRQNNNDNSSDTDPRLEDVNWLRQRYWNDGMTQPEIAALCGCDTHTVRMRFEEHGIDTRDKVERHCPDERLTNEKWLRSMYCDGKMDATDIAELCECSDATVLRWLRKFGIEISTKGHHQITDDRLKDGAWLKERYHQDGMTCVEIARECGCNNTTVSNWLARHDIDVNSDAYYRDERLRDRAWLKKRYWEDKMTTVDIADEVGCSGKTVWNWLKRHNIKTRDGAPRGENHPMFRHGKSGSEYVTPEAKRRQVYERDNHTCKSPDCSVTQSQHQQRHGERLHIHHLRKAREIEDAEQRHSLDNLITLCRDCHYEWEKIADANIVPRVTGVNS